MFLTFYLNTGGKVLPLPNADEMITDPFLPNLLAKVPPQREPITPPTMNIETMDDHRTSSCPSLSTISYFDSILWLQNSFITWKQFKLYINLPPDSA